VQIMALVARYDNNIIRPNFECGIINTNEEKKKKKTLLIRNNNNFLLFDFTYKIKHQNQR
jgi:hypothetical protein